MGIQIGKSIMNQKQALAALKLGLKVTRPSWYYAAYLTLEDGRVACTFNDHTKMSSAITEFLTQDHNDWQIYDESKTSNGSTSIGDKGT